MRPKLANTLRQTAAFLAAAVDLRDIVALSGLALLGVGVGAVHWPAGVALTGAVLLWTALGRRAR